MNENQNVNKNIAVKIKFPYIKKRYIIFAIIIITGLLFITNPSETEFNKYVEETYTFINPPTNDGLKSQTYNMNLPSKDVDNIYKIELSYERSNFYLFSIYHSSDSFTGFNKYYIGIFKMFF